jgi:hypothetical protein
MGLFLGDEVVHAPLYEAVVCESCGKRVVKRLDVHLPSSALSIVT